MRKNILAIFILTPGPGEYTNSHLLDLAPAPITLFSSTLCYLELRISVSPSSTTVGEIGSVYPS
jgi:hypothetical protein